MCDQLTGDWDQPEDDLAFTARFEANALALIQSESETERSIGRFLLRQAKLFKEKGASQTGDMVEKLTIVNHRLAGDLEDAKRDLKRESEDLIAVKKRIKELEAAPVVESPISGIVQKPNVLLAITEHLKTQGVSLDKKYGPGGMTLVEIASEAAQQRSEAHWLDQTVCELSLDLFKLHLKAGDVEGDNGLEANIIAYVTAHASKHGLDAEEIMINIAGGFMVSNTVPHRGRVRSARAPSLGAAMGSLQQALVGSSG